MINQSQSNKEPARQRRRHQQDLRAARSGVALFGVCIACIAATWLTANTSRDSINPPKSTPNNVEDANRSVNFQDAEFAPHIDQIGR